ncbi:hypothetical protein T08_5745 [Trichinella sp. T8]|nr:hypothetical protein T08_5745 [Trichinella sp. T8]
MVVQLPELETKSLYRFQAVHLLKIGEFLHLSYLMGSDRPLYFVIQFLQIESIPEVRSKDHLAALFADAIQENMLIKIINKTVLIFPACLTRDAGKDIFSEKDTMISLSAVILLSVLKSCIGVAGTSDNDSTQSTFKLVHLFVSHRSSEVPNKNKLLKNFIFFDLFQANAKIVNLFIISSSPGLNALRRQAHLLNATCYFVSSPAAFEAKKKEQLLSCIFTSSDSQDSGKSIFLNCIVPLKHNIKSIEEFTNKFFSIIACFVDAGRFGQGVMLTDEQVIDRKFLI